MIATALFSGVCRTYPLTIARLLTEIYYFCRFKKFHIWILRTAGLF